MRISWAYSIVLICGVITAKANEGGSLSLRESGENRPSFQLLGDLPGGAFMSRATAVSADGSTVVGYSTSTVLNPNGADEAFRWKDGQMLSLGGGMDQPASVRFSRASGVNGDGSVVVGDTRFIFTTNAAFRWQNGTMSMASTDDTFAGDMATNGNWAIVSNFGAGLVSLT